MLIKIQNFNEQDIKNSINTLIDRSTESPEFRQFAIQITQNCPDKIKAVYDWVRSNIDYVPDPIGIELFVSPIRLMNDHNMGIRPSEDCDGHAMLCTSLYRAIGINSNVVIIDSIGQGYDHAYSRALSEKLGWINVDTTSKYPLGWEYNFQNIVVV